MMRVLVVHMSCLVGVQQEMEQEEKRKTEILSTPNAFSNRSSSIRHRSTPKPKTMEKIGSCTKNHEAPSPAAEPQNAMLSRRGGCVRRG